MRLLLCNVYLYRSMLLVPGNNFRQENDLAELPKSLGGDTTGIWSSKKLKLLPFPPLPPGEFSKCVKS